MIRNYIIGMLLFAGASHVLTADPYIIPFCPLRNLIVIQATVQGRTGNFILDTGTSEMVLNSAYFEGKTRPIGGGRFQSIHGESQSNQGINIQLHLNGLSIRSYAVVIDLSPIEKGKRMNILGLVGIRALRQYEIEIDYFSQQIILYDLDRKGNRLLPKPLPIPTETLSFKCKEHLLYITARINDRELKLGLDTGVEANVLSPLILENLSGAAGDFSSKNVVGINGKTTQVQSAKIKGIQVGNLALPAMETIFMSTDPLNKLSGQDLDGLLGQEFLKQFRTAFNFKKKEICLWNEQSTKPGPLAAGENDNNL